MPDSERYRLRGGFDDNAAAFDRTRPVCPSELFDDLERLGRLATGKQVVEVGAGTGQATLPLAQRGLTITALELGPELASVARAKLAGFESVTVFTGSLEAWEPLGAAFDAVVSFNSLHWVDPELRYAKPARVLRPGGVLVVGGCQWARLAEAEPFWRPGGLPGRRCRRGPAPATRRHWAAPSAPGRSRPVRRGCCAPFPSR
jgi:SAM-dependent methyltransferase